MPIAPIYHYTFVRLYKPWVTPAFSPTAADPLANWRIDWPAKAAGNRE